MSEMWLPHGGVNRKQKELWLPSGGVNRKQKELWAASGGVNRKIFSGGVGYRFTTWVQNSASSVTINSDASGRIYSSEMIDTTHFSMTIDFDSDIPKTLLGDTFFKMSFTYTAKNLSTNRDGGGKPWFACNLNGSTSSVRTLFLALTDKVDQSGSINLEIPNVNINVANIRRLELYATCHFGYPRGFYEMTWNSGGIQLLGRTIYSRTGQLDIQI